MEWQELEHIVENSLELERKKQDNCVKKFMLLCKKINKNYLEELRQVLLIKGEDPDLLLKKEFLANHDDLMKIFYSLLKAEGFRLKEDVLTCISDLCKGGDLEKKIFCWKKFQAIKDLSIDEKTKMVTIISYTNKKYSFIPVCSIYGREVEYIRQKHMKEYPTLDENYTLSNGYNYYAPDNLDYCCHYVAEEFGYLYPECFIVSSICPHQFEGVYWYHSFNIDSLGKYVIDIANGFMMSLSDFMDLLEPTILYKLKGPTLETELEDILPEFKEEHFNKGIMPVALTHVTRDKDFQFLYKK